MRLYSGRMETSRILQLKKDALKIFRSGVDAALPSKCINKYFKVENDTVHVEHQQYRINKNVYLVGFGKAVAGMTSTVSRILCHHLISGVISVPEGTTFENFYDNQRNSIAKLPEKIRVLGGARDNLPDENSLRATQEITKFASQCPAESLLIVLISGGGSALLTLPIPPVTLEEKQSLIKKLSRSGADIRELNSVRKSLSLVKGGGLLHFISSNKVVALILSDVIGDPLDIIASSPTVHNMDSNDASLAILQKYGVMECIPESIRHVLQENSQNHRKSVHLPVQNVLVGSNRLSLEAAIQESQNMGYASVILTTELHGESRYCGEVLALLASTLYHKMLSNASDINNEDLRTMCKNIGIPVEKFANAFVQAQLAAETGKTFCVLCGGETTVTVKGNGTGGRSQELALAFSLKLHGIFGTQHPEILLLSAGTDGLDGPNDAAGAIGCSTLKTQSESVGMNADEYLLNNDSYHFYKRFAEGEYHVVTGHTGTNVMDIQILFVNTATK